MKTIAPAEYENVVATLREMVHKHSVNIVIGALAEVCSKVTSARDDIWLKLAMRLMRLTQSKEVKTLS